MATYVFSLGLIPVQDWIEKARRSRDLRAGSVLLCHLMAGVLVHLRNQLKAEIRLPAESPDSPFAELAANFATALRLDYGIPSRASGYCEAPDEARLREVFGILERDVVQVAWRELKAKYLTPGDRALGERFWPSLADLESYRTALATAEDCPVTLIWAARPAAHPREDLRQNLADVDRLYSEVKRSRPLRPWPFGETIGKCNQCGQREAIGPASSFAEWLDWHQALGEERWVQRGHRFDPGERLCHVCLTRRLAGYDRSVRAGFPSTVEMAARPWTQQAETDPQLCALLAQLRATETGQLDLARALLASGAALRAQGDAAAAEIRAQIDLRITAWNRERGEARQALFPRRPPAYLALLTFDGDDMGRHVRQAPEEMPRRMQNFAVTARGLLKDKNAEPFYLAGDEGLAMAPAGAALDLAVALREAFGQTFGTGESAPTLSLGVVFFEHTQPMAGALRAAREALAAAKRLSGKDALGVAVQTASGNRWSIADRWGAPWEGVRSAVGWVRDGRLAGGWAYDVESFLNTLPPSLWEEADLSPVREEVRRLFFRRFEAEGPTADARRRVRQEAWETLRPAEWWTGDAGPGGLRPRPEQFHLIGFLARQGGVAAGKEEG
jgi:hypothetical protein